tara:strand:+ start:1155 stop:1445 length:291 start_codon:yes stop_codon:yes gene_type:complete
MLIDKIKEFIKEISNGELKHLDPIRIRIYLSGLVNSEELMMSEYKTGLIPTLTHDLNQILDEVNDLIPRSSEQDEAIFSIAKRIKTVRDRVVQELV